MNENTRKYYIAKGEEYERASEYEKALASYLEAFSVVEATDDDDKEYFAPGFIEDKIAFLAYRLGDYRTALTYGGKAYRANPADDRLKNNLPFYTDGILFTNPKERLDAQIIEQIKNNFDSSIRILDVGAYDGRWYYNLRDKFHHIDAVEAFKPYVDRFELRQKYENVFITDIRNFDFDYYNIIILGDILEHLTVDEAKEVLNKLYYKCEELFVIIPYEYPQDEYDNNEYQVHKQEDLTHEIFMERYPDFELLIRDEVRGCYIKKGTFKNTNRFLTYDSPYPKTYSCGMVYFNAGNYGLAAGVFNQSLESMSNENKALMDYKLGICYDKLDKKLESLRSFVAAVEELPNYKNAHLEIMKILENLQLWEDLEYYVKMALSHINETNSIDENVDEYWKSLLLIQATLALSKQGKNFEAYGYATLAINAPMLDDRKKIAEYNYNELKKELWGTLQIDE